MVSHYNHRDADLPYDYLEDALYYHGLGFNVLPIQEQSKLPALSTFIWWLHDRQEANDVQRVMHCRSAGVAIVGGSPSGNAFFLDCETEEQFNKYSRLMSQHYPHHIAVRTARGGHFWLRAPFPVKSANYGDFEIRGQGQYVLAPPSIHPNGTRYEFTSLSRNVPIVSSLFDIPLEPAINVRRVSRFAHDLFRGIENRSYRSRSERDAAFILSLVRLGFDDEEIEKSLRLVQFESKYCWLFAKENDPKAASQYLRQSIKKARSHPESEACISVRRTISSWDRWAHGERWLGATGAMDKAMFLGHLHYASMAASLTYPASIRQLAEAARTSPTTASRVNYRLADQQLIKLHRKGANGFAHSYSLYDADDTRLAGPQSIQTEHIDIKKGSYSIMTICPVRIPDAFFEAVWERRGLGKSARLIWEALASPRKDYQAISRASGRAMPTVKKYMPKLMRYGLVEKCAEGYQQSTNKAQTLIGVALLASCKPLTSNRTG